MPARVTDIDKGANALTKRVAELAKGRTLTVGVHQDEGSAAHDNGNGMTVLEVATINEFGQGVPERSFIRAWADENEASHQDYLRRAGQEVVKGRMTPDTALAQVGEKMVGEVQSRIAGGIAPENAASTIRKKGSSTPLEDKGQLRSAITYKVE